MLLQSICVVVLGAFLNEFTCRTDNARNVLLLQLPHGLVLFVTIEVLVELLPPELEPFIGTVLLSLGHGGTELETSDNRAVVVGTHLEGNPDDLSTVFGKGILFRQRETVLLVWVDFTDVEVTLVFSLLGLL